MRYLPHTPDEVQAMLERIGVGSVDALFDDIPKSYRLERPLAIDKGIGEVELMRELESLAGVNKLPRASFLGGGMYDHHIPPAVDQLLLRSEFYTSYTPYQAEVAQGTLQSIFEFQTMVAELLGMQVANASMYCGASATAEAVLMARRLTKRNNVVLSEGLHPEYAQTVATYLSGLEDDLDGALSKCPVDDRTGLTDSSEIAKRIDDKTAAVAVGYPNFFGCIEDLEAIAKQCQEHGALLITATNEPYALALVEAPGHLGADIAVGEGQAMAVPPQLGGPGVGLFATKQQYLRQLPGRLVGETTDKDGTRGYVLTLSTREQHIRREKATSNICTNHGLIALAFTIRTAMLGRVGFEQTAARCLDNAEYLKKALVSGGAGEVRYQSPTFNEFTLRLKGDASAVVRKLEQEAHLIAGVPLGQFFADRKNELLVAVTEKHTRADLDTLIEALCSEAGS